MNPSVISQPGQYQQPVYQPTSSVPLVQPQPYQAPLNPAANYGIQNPPVMTGQYGQKVTGAQVYM